MGEPKPGRWREGAALADLVLGARWRFSDGMDWANAMGVRVAVTGFASLPTGRPPDPEQVAAAGTTAWDLQAQGEAGLHLGADQHLVDHFDDRVTVGLDAFYETFLPHRYQSGTGAIFPLLTNVRPYVGKTYRIDPGDYLGAQVQLEVIAFRGPRLDTWLSRSAENAELPPLLTVSARYNFTHTTQGDWTSNSPAWDWLHEQDWQPGYKSYVAFDTVLSLLRLGVPIELVGSFRDLTWLGGRSTRAPQAVTVGIRVPARI